MPKPEIESAKQESAGASPAKEAGDLDADFAPPTRARAQASIGAPPAAPGRAAAAAAPARKDAAVQQLAEASDAEKVRIVLLLDRVLEHDQVLAVVNTLASSDNNFLELLSESVAGQALIDDVIKKADALAGKLLAIPNVINSLALGIPGILIGFARRAFNMTTFTGIAIRQVFDVEFEQGSWSFEALRKMYLAFRMVPKTHVKGAVEKMTRTELTPGSSFGSKDKSINMARLPMFLSMGGAERASRVVNTRWMGGGGLSSKFLMKRSPYSQAMRAKNAFSMTALHEVGHAVDNKLGVMSKLQARPDFGGWEEYTTEKGVIDAMVRHLQIEYPEEPAEAAQLDARADERRTSARAQGLPIAERNRLRAEANALGDQAKQARDTVKHGAEREAYGIDSGDIERVNQGRDAENERKRHELMNKGVTVPDSHDDMKSLKFKGPEHIAKALFAGDKAKLAAFKNHPIMKAWDAGKKRQAWARSRSELAQTADAFGGRSFHQAYDSQWVSYNVAAKDTGVSHYAFRAPGEWFAELYAHYYMGTLKATAKEGEAPTEHPMYAWFHQAIHSDERNRPDGPAAAASLRTPEQVQEGNQPAAPAGEAAAGAAAEAVEHAGGAAKEGEAEPAHEPAPVVEEPAQAKAGGSASAS